MKVLKWKNALILLVVFLVSSVAIGQRKYLDIADEYYGQRKYKEAIDYYKLALDEKVTVNKYHMLEQVAKTYNHLFDYENAATYYAQLSTYKGENKSENLFEYGQVLRNLGKYEEARVVFAEYTQREDAKSDPEFFNKLVDFGVNHKDDSPVAKMKKTNIETGSRSLGLAFGKNGLIVGSPQTDKFNEKTIYYNLSEVVKTSPESFGLPVKLGKELNGPYYEGTPFMYADGTKLLFSSNSTDIKKYKQKKIEELKISEDGRNILKIYSAEIVDGEWNNVAELSFNSNAHNCVFPNLSKDGNTLYFSSDRDGGFGGYDIWKVNKVNDSTWSAPINLGDKVNTLDDETYPFDAGTRFYFSSKGKPGLGGSDIFVSTNNNGVLDEANNIGLPFNSPKDDFSFILDEEGDKGYFSTNREGAHGYDYIYYFYDYHPSEIISGIVTNDDTGETISGVLVELFKKGENGDWELVKSSTTLDDGAWQFEIDPNEEYKVEFTHPIFKTESREIPSINGDDAGGREDAVSELKEIGLQESGKRIEGVVSDGKSGDPIADVSVVLYEIDINGGRTKVDQVITGVDGEWGFDLDPTKTYEVDFDHPEFANKSFKVEAINVGNFDEREGQIEALKDIKLNDGDDNILAGIVLDKITEKPVSDVKVTLFERGNGEWKEVGARTTGADGKWKFDIDPNKEYKVDFDKSGFEKVSFDIPSIMSKEERERILALLNPFEMVSSGLKDDMIRIDNIYFDFARSYPKKESHKILDNIVDFMNANPDAKIELSAHTDAEGEDKFNLDLSQRRAEYCKGYIVRKGIKRNRIKGKGYGEEKILNGCTRPGQCTEEENQINRRVELKAL
jgi:outer membrane protein OmpA-like peptidoglycan-associated protein/tetratricopeptide (TPR) repeat protein